jgi:hypothetical protein
VRIEISPAAARTVIRSGGCLYLWQKPVSSTVAFEKQALRRPRGAIEFDRYQAEGVQVMIEAGIRLPAHLRVDRPRSKLRGVAVYFDGDRFGARGEFVGSSG